MVKPRRLNDRHLAYQVIGSQALLVAFLFVVAFIVSGISLAKPVLFGGMIALLANTYFALQAFRYSGARASSKMLQAFYRGEAGKFIIVLVSFVVAFKILGNDKTQAMALIVAFIIVQSLTWFAPLLLRNT